MIGFCSSQLVSSWSSEGKVDYLAVNHPNLFARSRDAGLVCWTPRRPA